MSGGTRQALRRAGGRHGHPELVRERSPKPRRRFRAGRLLTALHRASEILQVVIEPDAAAWAALVTLTAGEGFGFNRAFILLAEGNELRGRFGIGPRSRDEAARVWAELRRDEAHPLDDIAEVEESVLEQEQAKHAVTLAQLSAPLDPGSTSWRRPFVGRLHHPDPEVRRWVEVLDSTALAVIPMLAADRPWGVLLADNFVTGAPIYPGTLEAASTLANALRVALERTHLLLRLKEEERRRATAEHVTTLIETAQTLAHDLKNPLALAGGLARELAERIGPRDIDTSRDLATIAAAVHAAEERVAQLVDGLASRIPGVALAPLDVAEVVERAVTSIRPLATARTIHLVCQRPGHPVLALAEPSFLERCIENLVGNALQALREAQVIPGVVKVAVIAEGDGVRVEVADNGPPLPPPLRGDPFSGGVSTHRRGTGLGLVSVRRLVDAMGGRVEYDEREPGWVRFSLTLRGVT
jgi:signal transduction histidine kinase